MNNKKNYSKKKRRKKSSFRSLLLFSLIFITIALGVVIGVIIFSKPHTKSVQVHVKITDNGSIIMDYPITVTGMAPNAAMAFEKGCKQKNISYTYENGVFDCFNGLNSTETEGWMFYINNSAVNTSVKDCILKENDKLEFRYANYNHRFAQLQSGNASAQTEAEKETPIKVKVENNGEILLESAVMLNKENPNAADAFKNICDTNGCVYTLTDGNLISFKNLVNDDSNEWKLYLNNKLYEENMNALELAGGDILEFKYEAIAE